MRCYGILIRLSIKKIISSFIFFLNLFCSALSVFFFSFKNNVSICKVSESWSDMASLPFGGHSQESKKDRKHERNKEKKRKKKKKKKIRRSPSCTFLQRLTEVPHWTSSKKSLGKCRPQPNHHIMWRF